MTSSERHSVVTLRHGTRLGTRSEAFLQYAAYGTPDGPHRTDYYLWAIVTDETVIAVDSGFASHVALRRGREVIHDPVALFERTLGIDADDVDLLIATHSHYDHIGNLHRFPNATVVIAQAEIDFIEDSTRQHRLVGQFIEDHEIRNLAERRRAGRIRGVTAESEILPGIRVVPVGGHTPGQLMVEVDTSEGAVLLASDAVHFHEELEKDMPFVSSMNVPDTYRAFDDIRRGLADGRYAHVIPGHDENALEGMRAVGSDVGIIGHHRIASEANPDVVPAIEDHHTHHKREGASL